MDIQKLNTKQIKEIINKILLKSHLLPFITAIRILKVLEIDYGHFKSVYRWESVDKFGKPIPWFSYSAIEYLKSLDLSEMSVFEYGSGGSTIFWANHASNVTSTENNAKWFKKVINSLKNYKNAKIILSENKAEYVNAINTSKIRYDIVVIDGEYRYQCSQVALKKIKNNGLIILDNSERYSKIKKYFRNHNLIEIEFTGLGPINPYTSTTSFFITKDFNPRFVNKIKHPGSI